MLVGKVLDLVVFLQETDGQVTRFKYYFACWAKLGFKALRYNSSFNCNLLTVSKVFT